MPDELSFALLSSERAYAYFNQGNTVKALEEFNESIRKYPQNAYIYIERANFRQKYLGDKQGAVDDYTKAIEINSRNAFFFFWRSQIYYALGNAQRAIADYNEAIRIAPDDTMSYFFYSCYQKKL